MCPTSHGRHPLALHPSLYPFLCWQRVICVAHDCNRQMRLTMERDGCKQDGWDGNWNRRRESRRWRLACGLACQPFERHMYVCKVLIGAECSESRRDSHKCCTIIAPSLRRPSPVCDHCAVAAASAAGAVTQAAGSSATFVRFCRTPHLSLKHSSPRGTASAHPLPVIAPSSKGLQSSPSLSSLVAPGRPPQ